MVPSGPVFYSMKNLFVPILDNGGGAVRASFMTAFCAAMGGRNIFLRQFSDSLVGRNRNRACADFLASECDEMLMIDTDIVFNASHVDSILSHKVPLVYGMYPKKQAKLELCLCTMLDYVEDPTAILVEVRRAGSGFVKIHRSLLEMMKEENGGPCRRYTNHGRPEWDFWRVGVFDMPFAIHDGEYLSEDWSFCETARAMGVPVLVDQQIQLRHEGTAIYPLTSSLSPEPTPDVPPEVLTLPAAHGLPRPAAPVAPGRPRPEAPAAHGRRAKKKRSAK